MKKGLLLFALPLLLLASVQPVFADQSLPQDQVKSLLYDQTFDGVNTKTGRAFTIYFSPDGTIAIVYQNGKTNTGTWNVTDDGQHCVSLSGCSYVFDKGEGVYHKVRDGEQTHILKNQRAGKQL